VNAERLRQEPIIVSGQPLSRMLGMIKYPKESRELLQLFSLANTEVLVERAFPTPPLNSRKIPTAATTEYVCSYKDGSLPTRVPQFTALFLVLGKMMLAYTIAVLLLRTSHTVRRGECTYHRTSSASSRPSRCGQPRHVFFFFLRAFGTGCQSADDSTTPLIGVLSALVLQVILPFEHVVSITKDSIAFVIPNAIEVTVQSPGSAVRRQVRQPRPWSLFKPRSS